MRQPPIQHSSIPPVSEAANGPKSALEFPTTDLALSSLSLGVKDRRLQETSDVLSKRWDDIGRSLEPFVDRSTRTAEQSMFRLVHSLTAFEFRIVEPAVALSNLDLTVVAIGNPAHQLHIRHEGQHESFAAALHEITMPFEVRLRYPRTVGARSLTPERAQALNAADIKLRYPAFHAEILEAYRISESATAANKPTEAEERRLDGNLAMAERLASFVDEFNHRRHDPASFRLQIGPNTGEPVLLSAGDPETARSASAQIRVVRSRVLDEFAEFLKFEYFAALPEGK